MNRLFGTDGIRGTAGEPPLDDNTVARIGFSLANQLRSSDPATSPLIVIGRDTRQSGAAIEAAVAAGAARAGARVKSAGIITTPGVAYLTRHHRADAGVVISASHNPYQDNGIKIFSASGKKLSDQIERTIESEVAVDVDSFPGFDVSAVESDSSLKESYLDFLKRDVADGLNLKGMKIVIDCAEGASFELAPRLLTALGADVTAIHVKPDGRNINLNCGSLHPEELQDRVVKSGAPLGIAFDGDADRMLMVDEDGRLLDGDYILYILGLNLKSAGKLKGNRIVATVMSNLGLELALNESEIELVRTSVGDKYVLDELLRGGGSIGGEQSGHIIFPEISLAGDGMITAIELLRVLGGAKKSVKELAAGFTRLPQVILNVRVARKPPLESIEAVAQAIKELEDTLKGNGRILVRYSGTENLARIMIEGKDESQISRQARDLAAVIERELG